MVAIYPGLLRNAFRRAFHVERVPGGPDPDHPEPFVEPV